MPTPAHAQPTQSKTRTGNLPGARRVRRPARARPAAAALVVLLAGLAVTASLTPVASARPLDPKPSEPRPPAAPQPDPARARAKQLAQATSAEDRAAAVRLLRTAGPDADAASLDDADLLMDEIALAPIAGDWLLDALGELMRTEPTRRERALKAMSSIRTQESLRRIGEQLEHASDARSIGQVCDALARLTGRSDLGQDPDRWRAFILPTCSMTEGQWRELLIESLARRVEGALAERSALETRLAQTVRARYQAAATTEDRTRQIVELMSDGLVPMRELGLRLALQELANARPLGPGIVRSACPLLEDPDPQVRRLAAQAVDVLGDPEAAPALVRALERETDPTVAPALLKGAARWPAPGMLPAVLHWVNGDDGARAAAFDAAVALLDRGVSIEPDQQRQLLKAASGSLAPAPPERLPSPAALRLLALRGEPAEQAAAAALLTHTDPSVRKRAGEGLAGLTQTLDALLAAARSDSELFAPAARSLIALSPTPEGFATLSTLSAPSPEALRQQQVLMANRLAPADLVAVARSTPDLELREALLARLMNEPLARVPGAGVMPRTTTDNADVVAGLLLLCQTRLTIRQPVSALKTLDALEPVRDSIDPARLVHLRGIALACVGRIDEARSLGLPVDGFVQALELSLDQPLAPQLLLLVEQTPAPQTTPELLTRIASARRTLESFVGPRTDQPMRRP